MALGGVYTGVWTDYSNNGRSLLTLTTTQWSYILIFLAMLVGLASRQLWKLITYLVHQSSNHSSFRAAPDRIIDIILRNSKSPAGFLWISSLAIQRYRKSRVKGILRKYFLIQLFAVFAFVLSIVARLFLSELVVGNRILAKSTQCGRPTSLGGISGRQQIRLRLSQRAQAYNDACGTDRKGISNDCSRFVQRTIPINNDLDIQCPFDKYLGGVDTSSEDPVCTDFSYGVSTEPITSDQLGFNHPETFTVQHRMRCSVLTTAGHSYTSLLVQDDNSIGNYTTLLNGIDFGPLLDSSGQLEELSNFGNSGIYVTEVLNPLSGIANFAYTLTAHGYIPGGSSNTWIPISPFNVSKASTSLIGISGNTVGFFKPQNDPVFLADRVVRSTTGTTYEMSELRNYIGCIEQMQFCNPSKDYMWCSDWMAEPNVNDTDFLRYPGWTQTQLEDLIYPYILALGNAHPLSELISSRGGSGLLASTLLQQRFSADLSDEQWKLEVRNMFETKHIAIKLMLDAHATGSGADFMPGIMGNSPPEYDPLCSKRLYSYHTSEPYITVNMNGAIAAIAVSILIILLAEAVPFLDERYMFTKHPARILAWIHDDALHLFRAVMEGLNRGDWDLGRTSTIPFESGEILLARVDITSGSTIVAYIEPETVPGSATGTKLSDFDKLPVIPIASAISIASNK